MERSKNKSIITKVAAVVLSIGVFSTLFLGATGLALAAANNREVSVQVTAGLASIAAIENTVPEGYPSQSFKVNELEDRLIGTKSANAITAEKAAELGAQYIWDVMGERIDGTEVEMYYLSFPSSTRPYWYGQVRTGSEMQMLQVPVMGEDGQYVLDDDGYIKMKDSHKVEVPTFSFYFVLDGVTGERISIHRDQSMQLRAIDPNTPPIEQSQEAIDAENARLRALSGQYLPIVEEAVQKHFNNTKVVSVEYELGFSRFGDMPQMIFIAIDETGRQADITFDVNNKHLVSLCTQGNDTVPGYGFDWTQGEIPF